MTEEVWRDIKDYEGKYQISNFGRVKSLSFNKTGEKKLLKPHDNGKGYLTVCLWKNNKYEHKYIHRLVAETFIPNPDNKPCIDHINTIRNDNRVENLRWATYIENLTNPITREKNSNTHKEIYQGSNNPNYGNTGKSNPLSIPILQIDLFGNIINIWYGAAEAERKGNFCASTITKCCKGKKHTHKGYIWIYLDDYLANLLEEIQNEDMVA